MSWRDIRAILWLRWRLGTNRLARSGVAGRVLAVVVTALVGLSTIVAFTVPVTVGSLVLDRARPDHLMLLWDIVVLGFLLFWMIGVITELQRGDAVSLDKLLHLPISPRGAFLLNYVGSWFAVSILIFGSAMTGLAVALVRARGPAMLVVFPLIVTFLLMVTALTYQFRGWLAGLMSNKRRRGTIVVLLTVVLILIGQLPNLRFVIYARGDELRERHEQSLAELQRRTADGELSREQASRQRALLVDGYEAARALRDRERAARRTELAITTNAVVPLGWIAYGTRAADLGAASPAILASLGGIGIALFSLGRSYRTTLRLYTSGHAATAVGGRKARDAPTGRSVVERSLPWCTDQTSAVAFATLRSLTRTPQFKMLILTPVILLVLFAALVFGRSSGAVSGGVGAVFALGAVALSMLCLAQVLQNMFGFDRDGFRAFVLAPIERRRILIGKNLCAASFAITIGLTGLIVVQIAVPLSPSHWIATLFQIASVYLISCMVGNLTSIIGPVALAENTLRLAQPKAVTIVKQLALSLLFILATLPATIPLGVELLLDVLGWSPWFSIYLVLSAVELVVVAWVYRVVIAPQGRLLQRREAHIASEVTLRPD